SSTCCNRKASRSASKQDCSECRDMLERIKAASRLPGGGQIGTDQLAAVLSATPAALLCGLVNTGIVALDLWRVAPRLEVVAWLFCSLANDGRISVRRVEPRTRKAYENNQRHIRQNV